MKVSSSWAVRIRCTLALLALCAVSASAQFPLTQALPVDPKVTIGILPNGLKYYIRQNPKPEKRAELRLVVNAGSILETDNQLGLAHFIEHTAFDGTTHFKQKELINYLASIGVRFGADLNANTNFDETVYILPIPTDTARIVENAFQILEDWAHGQVFDSAQVTKERGVVLEEWRGRRGAGDRMLREWLPVAFKGSLYATRLPIGTEASITSATPARLRPFYNTWYRPDLMAVIAVGDFDKATIEALIKSHFGGLTRPANAPPRTTATVPNNVAPLVAIATDKEATSTNVDLLFKMPHQQTKTVADYRRNLVQDLYTSMLNSRLDEISQKPDAPFLGAGSGLGSFIARTIDVFSLSADVKDGGAERGLEALLVETRRVDQFGFLQSELDRTKANILRGMESAYAERDKTPSSAFVGEYVGNYLTGEPIPGIENENLLTKQLIPGITLAEVNAAGKKWITPTNRVIIAQAPIKDGVKTPTEADLLKVLDQATRDPVTAYTETVTSDALVGALPPAGRVVSEKTTPSISLTEWKLSNGARVLVKPTDFKADEILFSAYSPGGTSLAPDSLFMSADISSQIMALSGLSNLSAVDLGKKLSGKVASVSASIGELTEGLSGSASPKDLETLFQLAYLRFTAPRLDSAAYKAFTNQIGPYLANRSQDPDEVFSDTMQVTMSQHHFRDRPLTASTFAEIDPAKAFAFYKNRFADASDFTFVFVGNVTLETLKPLVEKYLATLPSIGRKETWRDIGDSPPKGIVERTVKKGTEPKANTVINFTGPFEYSPQSRFAMLALTQYFQLKLNETLREQLGGTYSPSVSGSGSYRPRKEYNITVEYSSSPANVDTLFKSTFALIETLKANGPVAADVEKVREQIIRTREVSLKTNSYWAGNIGARDQAGEDIAGLGAPYDEMVKGLTGAQIQAAAKLYFNTNNYAKFVLLPEK